MFWTLFSFVCFARFFYVWGYNSGYREGRQYAARRADAMIDAVRNTLDGKPSVKLVK